MGRLERIREIEDMRKAREEIVEDEMSRDARSEATRELEAFRASKASGSLKERYQPADSRGQAQSGANQAKAPRSKARSDTWMVNNSNEKQEEARMAREREMEMLMVARSRAIEEEEEERAQEEADRRLEAERKAHEMAALVADLQRMRATTRKKAEEEAEMTRYQEEMLARVMELHQIARGGIIGN